MTNWKQITVSIDSVCGSEDWARGLIGFIRTNDEYLEKVEIEDVQRSVASGPRPTSQEMRFPPDVHCFVYDNPCRSGDVCVSCIPGLIANLQEEASRMCVPHERSPIEVFEDVAADVDVRVPTLDSEARFTATPNVSPEEDDDASTTAPPRERT